MSERTAPDGEEVTVEWTVDGNSDFNYGLKTLAGEEEDGNVYRTLVLQWRNAIPDDFKAYTCDSITAEGELVLTEEQDTVWAGTPYIMYGPSRTVYWTGVHEVEDSTYTEGVLTGTIYDMVDDDFEHDGTQYLLQDQEDYGQAFYAINSDSNVSLKANHCYLTYTGNGEDGNVKAALSFPSMGEATGIKAVVKTTTDSEAIYDLSGRRVAKTQKGVYIKGGKKVLVK